MYDRCVYVDNLQIKGIKSKIYKVVLWNKEKKFLIKYQNEKREDSLQRN